MGTTNNFSAQTPRKLFVGPFQPDLESHLAAAVTAFKKQNGPLAPLRVVVPTQLLALYLQRKLARELGGHANIHFTTLTNLVPSQHRAPQLGLELLARQIVQTAIPADGYFKSIRDTPGFPAAMLSSFTDLKEAAVTPVTFKSSANTPKLRELAAAYAEFCRWLTDHDWLTEPDLFTNPEPQTPNSVVFLYGFYDLNAAQKQFITRLQPAAVFFPLTEHDRYSQPLLDWFKSLGYKSSSSSFTPHPSSLSVLSAPGETAEVREAARAIFDYLKTHPDKTFADVAILCRTRDQYDAILRDTLPELGVRTFFRGGRPLSEQTDAKLLLLLLEVIKSNFSRATVMELACHIGPNARWDAFSVRLGVVGGQDQWLARIKAAATKSGEDSTFANETAQQILPFLENLFSAIGKTPGTAPWRTYVDQLLAVYTKFGGKHPGVADAVRSLAELDAVESPVRFDTFAELCQRALDGTPEQSEKFQSGAVFVSDVMGARGLSIDFVVVLGLVEKCFPRLVREDPLLLDDERERIGAEMPLKRRGHDEEHLLFDLARGTARDQLILSYPRLDAGTARPHVPSFLLLEATGAKDFKSLPCKTIPLSAFAGDTNPVDERELDLAALRDLHEGAPYLTAISALVAGGVAGERQRWCERGLTGFDGVIEAKSGLNLLRDRFQLERLVISATSLEDFFGCPFYYFQKHILRNEPWEEPEATIIIDPADLGSLYHSILEDYYRRGAKADLETVIDEHFRQFEREGVTGYPTVWEIKKEIVRQELGAFVAREARRLGDDWKPSDFEKEFKGLVVAPPVRLRGKIDRIDRSPNGKHARVIDYKTGTLPASGLDDDSLAGGEALQLPLYLLAAEQLLPGVAVDAASYLYFTLRGGYREVSFSRSALTDRRPVLHELLQTAADMIRDGIFAQHATADGCRKCDFRPICGNGILKLAEGKKDDVRMNAYHTAKERAS